LNLAGPTLACFARDGSAAFSALDDRLTHSHLSAVGAVFARWLGREPLHGGGFVSGGRAFGLFGEKEAGKSTTLAALAVDGTPIVADDLFVVDGGDVLAGARTLDLRPEALELIPGAAGDVALARGGERRRLQLGEVAPVSPLGGWLVLETGADLEVAEIPLGDRLEAITPHRAIQLAPLDGMALLDVLAAPAWRVTRPPGIPPAELAARLRSIAQQ
jgi:hypothetical protein